MRKRERMTFVGVKMPQSMVDALDHVAKMRDETRSDVIR
ncbi:MAG: ribbon-helix-helix protein, CopG family, partial [Dehalococcoidia bacterium]|nr:ribbon-helix-helix protein, CopG family [Dehalococcoidia bacterium]